MAGRSAASNWLALGILIGLLVIVVAGGLRHATRPADSKAIIGTRDEVYYSHAASEADAQRLGRTLRTLGFFNDRGSSVLLSMGRSGTVVSFVVDPGAWDRRETIADFEEIGRRIATPLGGFPIKVRLVDGAWSLRRELEIGRLIVGARDEIYYFGSATRNDAEALGQALKNAGYLGDLGVSVELAKADGATVSFVVDDNVWDRADAVAGFEKLARQIAPSVGGLPLQLRLLNAAMEPKREIEVR
jgi:hypothetical protein